MKKRLLIVLLFPISLCLVLLGALISVLASVVVQLPIEVARWVITGKEVREPWFFKFFDYVQSEQ